MLEKGYHFNVKRRLLLPMDSSLLSALPDGVIFNDEEFKLASDFIGNKTWYYQFDGENLFFASAIKPLMSRPGFVRNIRKDVLSRYLYHQYICHPDTIFHDIDKLSPGSALSINLRGPKPFTLDVQKEWDVADVYHEMQKIPINDYSLAQNELQGLLIKAVENQVFSGQPLGAFLSGGYDSSLICAIAAAVSPKPLKTFTIGFYDDRHNEAKYAKSIASYLGTDHTEIYITEDDMLAMVASLPEYYDEPFADSSQIPMMLLAGLAAGHIKKALTGDGGDEIFCGYHIYEKLHLAQKMDIMGGAVHALLNLPGISHFGLEGRLPFRARIISANRDRETKVQFGRGSYVEIAEKMVASESFLPVTYPLESRYRVKDWQIRRMLLDMETYLPAVLRKVERAMTRYSLASYAPLLNREIIEYSFRLSHSFKYHKAVKKRILKDIAYQYIPRDLLKRPKAGFSVPLDKWMRGTLREQLTDMVNADFLRRQGLFNVDYTIDLVKKYLHTGDGGSFSGANHSKLIWAFFVFQKWYAKYIL